MRACGGAGQLAGGDVSALLWARRPGARPRLGARRRPDSRHLAMALQGPDAQDAVGFELVRTAGELPPIPGFSLTRPEPEAPPPDADGGQAGTPESLDTVPRQGSASRDLSHAALEFVPAGADLDD